jgi:hypothetical protein
MHQSGLPNQHSNSQSVLDDFGSPPPQRGEDEGEFGGPPGHGQPHTLYGPAPEITDLQAGEVLPPSFADDPSEEYPRMMGH